MPILKRSEGFAKKAGLPPGTLVHLGEIKSHEIIITAIDYTIDDFKETKIDSIDDLASYKNKDSVSWINVNAIYDPKIIEEVGKVFNLHPLLLEDILNTHHIPKVEDFDEYTYFVCKIIHKDPEFHDLRSEQVSLVVGEGFVISFQEEDADIFTPLRERLKTSKGIIRQRGADYLTYRLIDTVVDSYFSFTDDIETRIVNLEEEIITNPSDESMYTLQKAKKDLMFLSKSIKPLFIAVGNIEKGTSPFFDPQTLPFMRDVYDHILKLLESIEMNREVLNSLVDLYHSQLSDRMNRVMKVLTIIATIFIPLTFLAGIYGMNFKFMPELEFKWAYPALLGAMAVITAVMIIFFRRRKWW